MNLADFEGYMEQVIVDRGRKYFEEGRVERIQELEENHFAAEVDGSDLYTVHVNLDENGEIVDTVCNCPYDMGDYCKHQASVFFALKSERDGMAGRPVKRQKKEAKPKIDIKKVLMDQSKDELVKIILDFNQNNPEFENILKSRFASGEEEITASKKLIKEYIRKAKRNGFIGWRDGSTAVRGADTVLDNARGKILKEEYEKSIILSQTVLSIIVDVLQYCDDSDGIVGGTISESISLMSEAVSIGLGSWTPAQQKKIFSLILKESQNKRYSGWNDWQFALLGICVNFAEDQGARDILEQHLEELLSNGAETGWSREYSLRQIKLLQLDVLQRFDSEEKTGDFIKENLRYSEFRKIAIEHALEKHSFQEAIQLCLDGEEVDQEFRGLVKDWKELRFLVYEKMGDLENQKKLAFGLILENDYKYYLKLKQLCSDEEWGGVVDEILENLEEERFLPGIYERILVEEKLVAKILEYCRKRPSYIVSYYPHLIEEYPVEVDELFIKYILESVREATDRKKYKQVCAVIEKYKSAYGEKPAARLIGSLQMEYPRRPAFLDELKKMK